MAKARSNHVLLDTGPLVALFNPGDRKHAVARASLAKLERSTLITVEAVIAEASHLLRLPPLQVALQRWLTSAVEVVPVAPSARAQLATLLTKYADQPMDYADAVLVDVALSRDIRAIWTYDRRDFSVYRVGRRALKIVD